MIQLELDRNILLDWIRDNFMTLNEGKGHLRVCRNKHECVFATIRSTQIWEAYSAKLLVIHIDTGRKINMMTKIAKYLSVSL